MKFENELKALIKDKYKSVRAFSKQINIPYSTIDNIFKRGIMGVSVQVVLRICLALNIDVEKIADDKLVLKENNEENNTTIKLYKQLNVTGRAKADEYITDLSEQPKYTTANTQNEFDIAEDICKEINSAFKKGVVNSK